MTEKKGSLHEKVYGKAVEKSSNFILILPSICSRPPKAFKHICQPGRTEDLRPQCYSLCLILFAQLFAQTKHNIPKRSHTTIVITIFPEKKEEKRKRKTWLMLVVVKRMS